MGSIDKRKKRIIQSLVKTIPENEKALDFTANSLMSNQGDEVYKEWLRLCFYIAYIDNEIKLMLNASLTNGKAFTYLDKYTALMMHEAIDTVPKLYGKFRKAVQEAEKRDGQKRFDQERLKAGHQQYKAAIREITEDAAFMQDLDKMRNSVAAHHLDKQDSIQTLVDWYVSKRKYVAEHEHPEINAIITNAAEVALALHPLAQSLSAAIVQPAAQ